MANAPSELTITYLLGLGIVVGLTYDIMSFEGAVVLLLAFIWIEVTKISEGDT